MFRFLADLLPPADVCVNMLAMPHAPPAVTSPAPHRLPAAGPTTGEEPAAPYVRQRALARGEFRRRGRGGAGERPNETPELKS
jgi:hypothetical protein